MLQKMTAKPLPKKLNKEPLVDAVFEIRFSSSIPVSSVLPGFLFARINDGDKKIERLPAANIPIQMRELDQNLRFQPLLRLNWDRFLILMGDESLAIACAIPYPGWQDFKSKIIEVINALKDSRIIETVSRFSLKYVDIIDGKNLSEQIQRVNINLNIGNHILFSEKFNIRVEIPHDNYLHIVQIAAPSSGTLFDGKTQDGVLVAVDSISEQLTIDLTSFAETLADNLEAIHTSNKTMFFECLRPETITYLEPVYE
jgi:uncharacterized protein (TIGR04255 family)